MDADIIYLSFSKSNFKREGSHINTYAQIDLFNIF